MSYTNWLQQVEKELGRAPESYFISPEISIFPFLEKKNYPLLNLQTPKWIVRENIRSQEQLDQAIKAGIEHFNIHSSQLSLFTEKKGKSVWVWDSTHVQLPTSSELILPYQENKVSPQVWVQNQTLEENLFLAIQALSAGCKKVYISWKAQENFYINLAQIRALKYLCQRLSEIHSLDPEQIQLVTQIPQYSSDPNQHMIAATTMAISSIAAGTNQLLIQSPKDKDFDFYTRNIHFILEYETHLQYVNDPASGSYFIEELTRKIIETAWTQFIEINEKSTHS